jgi:hypothetical protein
LVCDAEQALATIAARGSENAAQWVLQLCPNMGATSRVRITDFTS